MTQNYTEEKQRLKRLANKCIDQLKDIGIHPPKNIMFFVEDFDEMQANSNGYPDVGKNCVAFTVNTRTGSQCIRAKIHVRPSVLREGVSEASSMHIIMHELLHACAPGCDHDGRWLRLAEYVNDQLHYDIGEYASHWVSRDIRQSEREYQERRKDREPVQDDLPGTQSVSTMRISLGRMNVIINGKIHVRGYIDEQCSESICLYNRE